MATGGTSDNSTIAQALSTLAGALLNNQSPQAPPVQNVSLSIPGPSNSVINDNSRRSSNILPSFLRRTPGKAKRSVLKKAKVVQSWDRDIVCLPQSRRSSSCSTTGGFTYPRGRYRADLGQMGLIGKIHLSSDMDEEAVKQEIYSVFKDAMSHDKDFPFAFLQAAGEGSKCLMIPSQSDNYRWTGQQVSRLAGQKGSIYILALADMPSVHVKDTLEYEENVKCLVVPPSTSTQQQSAEDVAMVQINQETSGVHVPINTQQTRREQNVDSYSTYVGLIDLTKTDSESDSDLSDLPDIDLSKNESASERVINPFEVKHVLLQHQKRVLCDIDEEGYQRINIRRSCLLEDTFRQFSKHYFNVKKLIRVRFIGEPAVDDGGPRREFFRLLMREVLYKLSKTGLLSYYRRRVTASFLKQ